MLENLVRIGDRLFNLVHVTSIEPAEEGGQPVMDVHLIPGRFVRLKGDDARAASFFVASFPPLPVDQAAQDQAEAVERAAQDQAARQFQAWGDRVDDTRA